MAVQVTDYTNNVNGVITLEWGSLGPGEAGDHVQSAHFSDKTVQVSGTLSGASVIIEGSNDGTNWYPCSDLQGDLINIVSPGLTLVAENPLYIRPNVSGGGGGFGIVVTIVASTVRT